MVHKIKQSWTKQNITHGIFLDVDGAFDKIWHNGLIAKIKQIGIEGKLLQLFVSYLQNRKQIVVVEGVKSNTQNITAGVPQGSKLGPLLFLIYINDITEGLESDMLIFADDCSLLSSGNIDQTTAILKRDLTKNLLGQLNGK